MSTTDIPQRYQPSQRLIDNPQKLREYYVTKDMTIRAIAQEKAEVSKTRVRQALHQHDIISETDSIDQRCDNDRSTQCDCHDERGVDPPTDWTQLA